MPVSQLRDSGLDGLGCSVGTRILKSHQVMLMGSQVWATGRGAVERDKAWCSEQEKEAEGQGRWGGAVGGGAGKPEEVNIKKTKRGGISRDYSTKKHSRSQPQWRWSARSMLQEISIGMWGEKAVYSVNGDICSKTKKMSGPPSSGVTWNTGACKNPIWLLSLQEWGNTPMEF